MARLEVEELSKDFGGVRAVDRVSFSIDEGTRVALIGPNGAGKTTLLNLLTGQLQPSGGRIVLDGKDITRSRDFERARLAIARTFQQSNLYPGLTVLENVRLAMQRKLGLRRSLRPVSSYPRLREECDRVLAEHDLAKLARTRTEELSYGDLRHLELALALVGETSVLFLDEPTAGMTPQGTREMIGLIQRIPRSITVCIVEHDMDVVFALADRVLVLHQGRLIAHDTPEGVKESSIVRSVYLGQDAPEVSP